MKGFFKKLLLDWQSIGYSNCYRCKLTWNIVESHTTAYNELWACFPLCEGCWGELTPDERLPYYRKMYDSWDAPEVDWMEIEKAVLNGG